MEPWMTVDFARWELTLIDERQSVLLAEIDNINAEIARRKNDRG